MSHTVHPYAHRLGILRDWRSRWFVGKRSKPLYRENLKADVLLREYLEKQLRTFLVDAIEMERGQNSLRVIVKTARPGMIIGRSGEGSNKVKDNIIKFLRKSKLPVPTDLRLIIEEVRSPESHSGIVAHMIEEALEKRTPFRRTLKQAIEKVMANKDVKGVRITLSGVLDGGSMGRTESILKGRLPLQTLRADIDYAQGRAKGTLGAIGIKVWIYRGEIFEADSKNKK
ncbi:MAG TPA: 30S ribosomal protein S3 [Candidatus Paceibacterota bacterium]